ncbi:4111_t:CDS:10 [Paraglomus occultum]|uniref:Queuosine 5'-phosphate N-glycosylase/hydrolase n=1 Tax=Paraglomus occultum TaxID=144539 RepID=A0A9N9BSM9_9GLOM|nr:4111_t:CDS:10 [Paraglomus occultum]
MEAFVNPVLESAKFISENSKDVVINEDSIKDIANTLYENMKKESYSMATWKQHQLHPKTPNEQAIDWQMIQATVLIVLVFHSMVNYTLALAEKIPITTASVYASEEQLTDEQIKYIFRSDTTEQIPLLQQRIMLMREAGRVLVEKFGGTFVNCVREANKSAMKLLEIITENFASFRDENEYKGRTVKFYKRAQILIADIWACFESQSYGEFHDIDEITMFADYRVPQALYRINAISYSSHLISLLDALTILPNGSRLEIEIRGCSIWAVELIRRVLVSKVQEGDYQPVNAILIDFFIWDYAKEHQSELRIRAHRTRSIYY